MSKKREYEFKVPEGKHMLPLSRERSINARLKNLVNWEKDSLKHIGDNVSKEEKG